MLNLLVKGNSAQALDACAKRGIAAQLGHENLYGETRLQAFDHDAQRIARWHIEVRDGEPYKGPPVGTLMQWDYID